jgi:hypothetical protein
MSPLSTSGPTHGPSRARTFVRTLPALLLVLTACGGGDDGTAPGIERLAIDVADRMVIGDTIRPSARRVDGAGRPVSGGLPATIEITGAAALAVGPALAVAIDTGTVTIVATEGTTRAERTVTIGMPPQFELRTEPLDTARIGDTTRVLAATVRRGGAALATVPVRWTVADTSIASIERRGTATFLFPRRAGTTELVARVGAATVVQPVRIFGARLVNFAIDVTTQVLDVGDSVSLAAGTIDAEGRLVLPDEVTYDVVSGGGVLAGTRIVRGTAPGLVVVRARARGQETIDTLTVVPPSRFTVDIRVGRTEAGGVGVLSDRARAALDRAVKRWRQVIREDLPPQPVRTATAGPCRAPVLDETITGVVIFARELDLGTGIVAQAAACILRPDGRTVVGFVEMNSRFLGTLTETQLVETMIHELAHAFGFGSAWRRSDGFARFVASTGTARWTGPVAAANFAFLRNTAAWTGPLVPVAPDLAHWNGTTFRAETMEPTLRPQNRLSAITIGAFADMGYVVNDRSWERYALPGIAVTPSIAPLSLANDVVAPYGVAMPDGTVRRLP